MNIGTVCYDGNIKNFINIIEEPFDMFDAMIIHGDIYDALIRDAKDTEYEKQINNILKINTMICDEFCMQFNAHIVFIDKAIMLEVIRNNAKVVMGGEIIDITEKEIEDEVRE